MLAFTYTFPHPQSMEAHRQVLETFQSILLYRSLPRQYPAINTLIALMSERLESSKHGGICGMDGSARGRWEAEVTKLDSKLDGRLGQLDGLGLADLRPVGLWAWWFVRGP